MTPLEINKRIAELKNIDINWGDYGNGVCPAIFNNDEAIIFNWAEDISDAWELFEDMPGLFLAKTVSAQEWSLAQLVDGGLFIKSAAYSAPMAICIAWIDRKEKELTSINWEPKQPAITEEPKSEWAIQKERIAEMLEDCFEVSSARNCPLSSWDQEFLASVSDQFVDKKWLSPKQIETLEKIWDKI